MKRNLVIIILALLVSSAGSAQEKQKRDVDGFTSLSFGAAGELFLTQGNHFSVELEGDKDLLEEIETVNKNGRLVIRKRNWRIMNNKKITVYITMPEIDGLSVSGSGSLEAEGPVNGDDFNLNVSGSGTISLNDLNVEGIDCSISGSGDIRIKGSAKDGGEVFISGSGKYYGEEFRIGDMEISISGSGNCRCWVEGDFEVRVSGSGSVYYKGDPEKVDARISGSGKVRKL